MKRYILILFAASLLSTVDVSAQKGKPSGDLPATTTINDSDASGTAFRIQSDGKGSYVNKADFIESIIQGIGDWEMDGKASSRRVHFDFGDPVAPGATAPFTSGLMPTRFISKCSLKGFKMIDIPLGETRLCPLATSIDYAGSTYRIAMNPDNETASDWVSWTCLAASNGKCTSWELTPVVQADGQVKSKGQLIKVGTSKRNPDQLLGVFYFTFKINVTTP